MKDKIKEARWLSPPTEKPQLPRVEGGSFPYPRPPPLPPPSRLVKVASEDHPENLLCDSGVWRTWWRVSPEKMDAASVAAARPWMQGGFAGKSYTCQGPGCGSPAPGMVCKTEISACSHLKRLLRQQRPGRRMSMGYPGAERYYKWLSKGEVLPVLRWVMQISAEMCPHIQIAIKHLITPPEEPRARSHCRWSDRRAALSPHSPSPSSALEGRRWVWA